MASIEIKGGGGGGTPLDDGNLTIKNGLPIDATLQTVSDVAGNDSILNISTASVGIGTTTATGLLNLYKAASTVRLMINGDAGQNRLITYRTGGVQRIGLYLNNTAETGSNAGSDFAIRRYTDAGALGGTPLFIKRSTGNVGINTTTPATTLDVNGTANIAERLTIEADSTATTQSTAVIQNTTANSGIALVPNGTGAITAQIPDGTATGGNARGTNAVDLQTIRGINTQVAGSQAVIVGGASNTAAGSQAVVVGGQNNRALTLQSFIGGGSSNSILTSGECAIVGGTLNTNNGVYGFIGAGVQNTVSTTASTISGGQSNTASTGTHATVVGGQSNVSSGQYSVSGGKSNTSSGESSTAFGNANIASGDQSCTIGGNLVTATGTQSVAGGRSANASGLTSFSMGFYSNAQGRGSQALGEEVIATNTYSMASGYQIESYLYGQFVRGNGALSNSASCQYSDVLSRRLAILNSAATTVLSLDGTGTTNLIIPYQNNRTWNVKVSTVAVVSAITGTATGVTVGDSFMENRNLLFKRVSGTSSVVGVGTVEIISDTSMATALMTYTAGASQELALTFTAPTFVGGGSLTIRVVSKVILVEVAY